MRIVCQTVKRITNESWELKGQRASLGVRQGEEKGRAA